MIFIGSFGYDLDRCGFRFGFGLLGVGINGLDGVDWFEMSCFVLAGDSWVGFGRNLLGCWDLWVSRLGRVVIIRSSLG